MTDLPPVSSRIGQTSASRQLDLVIICLTARIVLGLIFLARGDKLPVHSPNDLSRWATVYSLAERGTYKIDDTPWPPTIDRVLINGHTYSSKPPLLPTLLAMEYLMLKEVSLGRLNFQDSPETVIRILVTTVNLFPLLTFLFLYSRFLEDRAFSQWTHVFCLVSAALGTYLTSYCITLNNHTVASFSVFFALYGAYQIWIKGKKDSHLFVLTGLFAGFAAVNELPAVSFLVLLSAGFLWKLPRQTLRFFVPLALLPIVGHFVTNYIAIGSFKPAYANMSAYDFPGSYWKIDPQSGRLVGSRVDPVTGGVVLTNLSGIDNQYEPWHVYLFHMLIGHHGIFSLSPIFLFSFLGIIRCLWDPVNPGRVFALAGVLLTLLMLIFYTFFAGQRNYGGMCNGLRWLFWLIPFWLICLPEGLNCNVTQRWFRAMALACLVISAVSVFYATKNPWTRPWLHEWFFYEGWIGY
jgi:hypothetical protein